MASIKLTVLNAVGCLLLAAVVVVQWSRERDLNAELDDLTLKLGVAGEKAFDQELQIIQLEKDIESFKESLAAAKKALDGSAGQLKAIEAERAKLAAEYQLMRQQIEEWNKAILARDAQLKEMNAELVATRAKLDEAVRKLKAVSN